MKTKTKRSPAETGAKFPSREDWLLAAATAIRPIFDAQGAADYPRFRVSCGFPKGGRGAIGQAWTPSASGDETAELFISPELETLAEAGSPGVLDVLAHELIHAIVGNEAGHKGPFRQLAKGIGLEGKMTATYPSEKLADELLHLVSDLGPYPHATLSRLTVKKQTTRMKLCECHNCGCKIRMTQKWLDEVGAPTCGCGNRMEPKA